MGLLVDGKPRGIHEISVELGLSKRGAEGACYRGWRDGSLLRSAREVRGKLRVFRGRAGSVSSDRGYFLYLFRVEGQDSAKVDGVDFVPYGQEYLSNKIPKGESKTKRILRFLKENQYRAWYTTEIVEALKDEGVNPSNVMPAVRRYEQEGVLFLNGYRTDVALRPFSRGFLVAFLNPDLGRDQAREEALAKTEKRFSEDAGSNVIGRRVMAIRDQIVTASSRRELVGFDFLRNHINCSEYQLKFGVEKMLQLYLDIKRVDVFKNPYFYSINFPEADLKAQIVLKENLIRQKKGRDNRIGHNFESVVEWYVEKQWKGAKFITQKHRDGTMDPKRITLHLIKSVSRRRGNAEVDRIWSVKNSPIAPETIYVLQCKYSVVTYPDLEDHLNVLRWSQEYGTQSTSGQVIRQNVVPVYAGGAFDPRGQVRLGNETISLATYAERMNLQLIKSADINEYLHKHGVNTDISLQKICELSTDEKETRSTLVKIWNQQKKAKEFLTQIAEKNKKLYDFEKSLEQQ